MQNIPELIQRLGGIGDFVSSGESVGFLVNSPWKHPGTYTHPDVALACIKHFKDAGAGKIVVFKPVPEGYWERSVYYNDLKDLVAEISYSEERTDVAIPGGKELKKATVFRDFLEVDRFVNIPVAKHHAGTYFSCNLKNLMGVSTSETNRKMHSREGKYTYGEHEYLAQCIADLNLVRAHDLAIVDALECVLNNGPRGPGETVKPDRILAGTDPVALDVYAAGLIGFHPEEILMFAFAGEHGLGKSKPEDIVVSEIG